MQKAVAPELDTLRLRGSRHALVICFKLLIPCVGYTVEAVLLELYLHKYFVIRTMDSTSYSTTRTGTSTDTRFIYLCMLTTREDAPERDPNPSSARSLTGGRPLSANLQATPTRVRIRVDAAGQLGEVEASRGSDGAVKTFKPASASP